MVIFLRDAAEEKTTVAISVTGLDSYHGMSAVESKVMFDQERGEGI